MKKTIRIIIEGVDGCGKTTTAELLSKKLKIPIIKMPNMKEYFEKGTTEQYSRLFNETVVQFSDTSFILDRGFPSSLVYSQVYNRPVDISYIDQLEKKLKAKVVILTALPEVFLKRKPYDDIISGEKRIEINEEYLNVAQERGYPAINTSNLTPKQVVKEVMKVI